MKTPDPLPCPWCGEAPDIRVDQWCASVACVTPTCSVQPYTDGLPSVKAAVNAWNKRRSQ